MDVARGQLPSADDDGHDLLSDGLEAGDGGVSSSRH